MSKETEKKVYLNTIETEDVIKRCESIFGITSSSYIQKDEYFDNPDQSLQKLDYTIRLRTDYLPEGEMHKIAVKGPRTFLEGGKGYTRIDIEFLSVGRESFLTDTASKGLICVATLEKQRWKFKNSELKITIDEYPFIGNYLEIESKEAKTIDHYIQLLNFSSKPSIQKNSTELLEEKLVSLNLSVRPNLVATFELEKVFTKKLDN